MIIKNAKVFREEGAFYNGDIVMCGEIFVSHAAHSSHAEHAAYTAAAADGEVLDASGCYAIPGLIDIHQHGCVGYDFSKAPVDGIREMVRYQALNGITAVCATTATLPEDSLMAACRRIVSTDEPHGAELVGVHLEGPFLSPEKRGAHNLAYIQAPDVKMVTRLQEAANGQIRMIAIAPEVLGAQEFIGAIHKEHEEIVCSLAHTVADYQTALGAFECGAWHVTHLFNAMPPLLHRDPGLIGAALDTRNVFVELICDGVHIHPSVVRAALRMFGDDRVVMISDSLMATGLSDGSYEFAGLVIDVHGDRAVLAGTDVLAGSTTHLMDCMRKVVGEMGIPLESAVKCVSVNPAKSIGIFDRYGSITPGKYADLVILNEDLSIRTVFLKGKTLF